MLDVARRRGVRETVVGRAEVLPFPNAEFHMVTMSYMLRHVEDLERAFCEARRVLRPGGKIVIFELTKPSGRLASRAFHVAMHHALPIAGVVASRRTSTYPMMRYWAETIDTARSPESVVRALEGAGFRATRHVCELGVFSNYRGFAP
jgi:demethylmenaquinone methyltransferase/2-methoxy-6-polyprenyl-1,4-benzoquinol methylase